MRSIIRSLFSLTIVALATTATAASDQICRALVMSGGANKGAYEAGVIHGLSHLLKGEEAYYDVVSGVSAGALNSAAIAMWPKETAIEMSEWLVQFWKTTTSDMIFQQWPGGFEQGLNEESGLFDSSPLLNTLTETMAQLGGIIQRKIVVAAVDVNTGDYVTYTEANSAPEEFPQRALASSSIPFVFPHQHIGDRVLMDGGTVWNTNLVSAIERCMETVDSHSKITMDIVICSNDRLEVVNATGDTIVNYLRYWSVSSFHNALSDVKQFKEAFPDVNYRYFFMASKPLASGLDEMNFSPEILDPMIQIGMDDAANMIKNTLPGESFKRFDKWVKNHENVKLQHPHLSDYLYATEIYE